MQSPQQQLLRVVRTVRNRWRLKVLLRGVAQALLAGAALLLVVGYAVDATRFDATTVNVLRALTYLVLATLAAFFIGRPLLRRVSDERVALYLEENEPALRGHLTSALELSQAPSDDATSDAMVEKIVRQAVDECQRAENGKRVERKGLFRSTGLMLGSTAASVVLFLIGPAFLLSTTPLLLDPFREVATANPYSLTVEPGDVTLARGADLEVTVRPQGFAPAEAILSVRPVGSEDWEEWPMLADDESHRLLVFDLQEATEYRVEASGVRSTVFEVTVTDLPYVENIDVTYNFPDYTGLDPLEQPGSGDLSALVGTTARLALTPTIPVAGGALEVTLDNGDVVTVELEHVELEKTDKLLHASLTISQPGTYQVLLDGPNAERRPASSDYVIDPVKDQPPILTLAKPGRDLTVTPLEEVEINAEARDDFGITRLELFYSVNGGPEQNAVLYGGSKSRKEVAAGHTFYLEEMGEDGGTPPPGDLVAYYVRAHDGAENPAASSDIYFLEVRPFERNYRQADSGGMPGGGQGVERGELAQQQRMVVAAIFKLIQRQEHGETDELNGDLATVALSQGRLRESVLKLVERMQEGGAMPRVDSPQATIAGLLPAAASRMAESELALGEQDPEGAMPAAQQALQILQRIEAEVRDVQIARGQQQGGGGGQSEIDDELADLFEMDMERLGNQYEEIQRSRQEGVDAELDETLAKLRELARRQQQENERMRARSRQAGQQQGQRGQTGQRSQAGSSSQSQRDLADEAEEAARRLERLARQESLPELAETARQLREAAAAMRRAAAAGEQTGESMGRSALDQLREARRQLERDKSGRIARDTRRAMERAESLRDQQERMIERVERLDPESPGFAEGLRGIRATKEQMSEEVGNLATDLEQLAREALREQPDAARHLDAADDEIRNEQIREKILYSQGVIEQSKEYARNFENQIAENLDGLLDVLDEAQGAIGTSREQRLEQALEETREVVTGLESLGDRLRDGDQRRGVEERQLEREIGQRRLQLEAVGGMLRREGVDVGELEGIISGLRSLPNVAGPGMRETLEKDIVRGLKEFEYALRRSLGPAAGDRLVELADEDVPDGYEELVEKYYKALAQEENRP